MKNFTWENFDNEFLKAVIYSPETNADDRPLCETDEKDDLVCSMNLICTAPVSYTHLDVYKRQPYNPQQKSSGRRFKKSI